MNIETQKDTVIMPEKTNRIAWRKPQLTEVGIEDVTDSNASNSNNSDGGFRQS